MNKFTWDNPKDLFVSFVIYIEGYAQNLLLLSQLANLADTIN